MPFAIPTLDGLSVFGLITKSSATPKPPRRQRSSFAGQNGELDLFLGTNGWNISIEGVFQESTILGVQADFVVIYGYTGPGTHTYTDTKGNQFPNLVVSGQLTPDPMGPKITDIGWVQGYTLQLETLL